MKYMGDSFGREVGYPDHDVPPSQKDAAWNMQYARAAYNDWAYSYPKGCFSNNGGDYEKFRMYALGKQPISQYKKLMGVDQQTNNTWLTVDWNVRSIVSTYRDRTISELMKEEYKINASPVDMLAKSELDGYLANMKTKLAVRDMMLKQNPELANHPLLSLQNGEPTDIEELEMRLEMNEQFNRSEDAELAIELGLYENNYKHQIRRKWFEDLFDLGVAGYFEWLGDDNKAKCRVVDPNNVITSYSKNQHFTDIIHAGEVTDVSLIDLALLTDKEGNLVFTEKELQEFAGSIAGKWGNPMSYNVGASWFKPYDKFKCKVFECYFYTYNEHTYTNRIDASGNPVFKQEESGKGGRANQRYQRKKIKYVYKCSWIVGTEKCYNWGMCYDQKRSNNVTKKAETSLPYKFVAYNFYEMKAQGFMERLIPYIDDYQLTMLKIQNFKNRAVPSGWWIDLSALESVALNKGGKNMQPKELLQMFFETGVLVGRSVREDGTERGTNWKPVIPIANTAAGELAMFYQDLINTIQSIERIVGYNDITAGNPNPKTLVPGYQIANNSTKNSIYPLAQAEEYLSLKLSQDILCRMQQGIKKTGQLTGYAPALNSNTIRFISLSGDILRDYGIELERKLTDEQRMWLLQQMQAEIAQGFLGMSDAIILLNTKNTKQAMGIFSYRSRKAKEKAQENQLAQINANNDGAKQAAELAQQYDFQKIQFAAQVELQKKEMEIRGELMKEQMRLQAQKEMTTESNMTKLQVGADQGEAKITAQVVSSEGDIQKTHLAGLHDSEKQRIANQKPKTTTSK